MFVLFWMTQWGLNGLSLQKTVNQLQNYIILKSRSDLVEGIQLTY